MKGTNWVKVSERLPEIEEAVFAGWFSQFTGEFVYHKFIRTEVEDGWVWAMSQDRYLSDESWYEQDDDSQISHWMPLPLPPMPGGE